MDAKTKGQFKMVHVNKRRMQSYTEFIKGYKQYKDEKKGFRMTSPAGHTALK